MSPPPILQEVAPLDSSSEASHENDPYDDPFTRRFDALLDSIGDTESRSSSSDQRERKETLATTSLLHTGALLLLLTREALLVATFTDLKAPYPYWLAPNFYFLFICFIFTLMAGKSWYQGPTKIGDDSSEWKLVVAKTFFWVVASGSLLYTAFALIVYVIMSANNTFGINDAIGGCNSTSVLGS